MSSALTDVTHLKTAWASSSRLCTSSVALDGVTANENGGTNSGGATACRSLAVLCACFLSAAVTDLDCRRQHSFSDAVRHSAVT